jgi:lipopolysaccharide/colanic/teichoic acid biosynthesis glycosyltransferase
MSQSQSSTTRIARRRAWMEWSRTTTTILSAIWPPRISGITSGTTSGTTSGITSGLSGEGPQSDFPRPLEAFIRAEQARVDRFGTHFCVVTFIPAERSQGDRDATPAESVSRLILDALTRRVRTTDVIGRLGTTGMGVVLPLTDPEGASVFATDIVEALHAHGHDISYRIYSHAGVPPQASPQGPPSAPGQGPGQPNNSTITRGDNANSARHHARPNNTTRTATRSAEATETAQATELLAGMSPPQWKRMLDITGSAIGLLLLAPSFLLLAVYIKIVSPGPVFFRQTRIGLRGMSFRIWKLRTMHVNSDTSAHRQHVLALISGEGSSERPMQKLDDGDSRIIRGGLFLRRSSIDELPQLINVLLGDMSLVGPRPEMPYAYAAYQPWQARRFDVLPGMTGLWQVSGKNRTTFREMIRLDIRYGRALSPLRDAAILVRTVPVVLYARNGTDDPSPVPPAPEHRLPAAGWNHAVLSMSGQFVGPHRWTPSLRNTAASGGTTAPISPSGPFSPIQQASATRSQAATT